MPYSAVTQPSPLPRRKPGTWFSTLAVHSTRVSPKQISTEPSAWRGEAAVRCDIGRSWSGARPLGRCKGHGEFRLWQSGRARLPFAGPHYRWTGTMIRSMTAFAAGERDRALGHSSAASCVRSTTASWSWPCASRRTARRWSRRCANAWPQKVARGKIDLDLRLRVRGERVPPRWRSTRRCSSSLPMLAPALGSAVSRACASTSPSLLRCPGVLRRSVSRQCRPAGRGAGAAGPGPRRIHRGARTRRRASLAAVMRERLRRHRARSPRRCAS